MHAVDTNVLVRPFVLDDARKKAIEWFRRGMDLADALHLASSAHTESFLTFDVAMRRRASALDATPPAVAP
jgi:predicted nucleic acid-binding protein